ncbi:alpha-glucosidase [Lactobacillus plantarum JDM1] [Lacticaseibacillus rhamnosus]|nr:alpha-glucosidase [Lactobacillus plantarum JDM1] [Lacticaseibacillus rhamnosus]
MQGTPYIYQGEELGMTDAHFTELTSYRDIESLNAYRDLVTERQLLSPADMMARLAAVSYTHLTLPTKA